MLRWAAAVAWIALTIVVSVVPSESVPNVRVRGIDKVAHFVMYAAQAALVLHALRRPTIGRGCAVALACAALGALLELAQGASACGRAASVGDAVANAAGAVCAATIAVLAARRSGS
jgi:VanZ family protein